MSRGLMQMLLATILIAKISPGFPFEEGEMATILAEELSFDTNLYPHLYGVAPKDEICPQGMRVTYGEPSSQVNIEMFIKNERVSCRCFEFLKLFPAGTSCQLTEKDFAKIFMKRNDKTKISRFFGGETLEAITRFCSCKPTKKSVAMCVGEVQNMVISTILGYSCTENSCDLNCYYLKKYSADTKSIAQLEVGGPNISHEFLNLNSFYDPKGVDAILPNSKKKITFFREKRISDYFGPINFAGHVVGDFDLDTANQISWNTKPDCIDIKQLEQQAKEHIEQPSKTTLVKIVLIPDTKGSTPTLVFIPENILTFYSDDRTTTTSTTSDPPTTTTTTTTTTEPVQIEASKKGGVDSVRISSNKIVFFVVILSITIQKNAFILII